MPVLISLICKAMQYNLINLHSVKLSSFVDDFGASFECFEQEITKRVQSLFSRALIWALFSRDKRVNMRIAGVTSPTRDSKHDKLIFAVFIEFVVQQKTRHRPNCN